MRSSTLSRKLDLAAMGVNSHMRWRVMQILKRSDCNEVSTQVVLEPLFLLEIPISGGGGNDHHRNRDGVCVGPTEFGHIVKVHPIPCSDHHQRRGYDSDHSQEFHDFAR